MVRGGPWCLKRLTKEARQQLQQVADAVQMKKSLCEEVAAVLDVAKQLSKASALARHLAGKCFRCGGSFGGCHCRGHQRQDMGLAAGLKRRSGRSTKSGSSKSGASKRKKKAWPATDEKYKRHKWGIDAKESRREDNLKYPHRWRKSS